MNISLRHPWFFTWLSRCALILSLLQVNCPGKADPRLLGDWGVDARTPGDSSISNRFDVPSPKDSQPKPDKSIMPPPPDSSTCTQEDAITTCDPVKAQGCPPGAGCYLVVNGGNVIVDCRCPAGTFKLNEKCEASAECAPSLGCHSESRTCRMLCDPQSPQCQGTDECKRIDNYPSVGFCTSP